jgi:putative SOS response-associated peptidase YedK
MCSNFQSIKNHHANWIKQHFDCELPQEEWCRETYPTYPAPFIYINNGKPTCALAQFGLVPHWASDIKKFGLKTYNARTETVHEKPSYKTAWKEKRFGLAIMESFYEPSWQTGKAVRWKISRSDSQPIAVASIWERFIDKESGEIVFSFSMLTVNADGHEVMKNFHKPDDEKRSIVVLQNTDYLPWLHANHQLAKQLLLVAPSGFLQTEAAPRLII